MNKNTADVIVVGGGIIGCAAAYYLRKRGASVIVLEADDSIGNGSSSRNGGGVRQSGRDSRELPLAKFGIENLWPTLSEELCVDVEYHQDGNLRLGKTEKHLAVLKKLADTANACGVHVEMLSDAQVRAINPHLSGEVIGASWCPTDGHANPLLATLGYYKRARELGVHFLTGQAVVALKKTKGRLRQVITAHDTFEGNSVILAAGLQSRKIAASVDIDIPMQAELIEALVTEAQPPMFWQMLGTAEADFYGHQSDHGSFVFGGNSGLEGYTKDNGTPVTSSITASCICRGIMRYLPRLKNAKIIRTWAGWMDMCVDRVPVISHVEEVPGLILACGFSGHGFGIAPAVGYQLAMWVMEGRTTVDLSPLRYDRFKAKI
ncbi:NAD(P)/FAD-dependent oxidoreductase [Ethanoligenens sp.]|uniref:NAD(P)/FAD-dependent oxidoreductase n=1 Tax=Ethanoligenens sp. TaxID=2099655 RepID=UPI0039E9851F